MPSPLSSARKPSNDSHVRRSISSRRLGRAVLRLARETAWGHESLDSALRCVTEFASRTLGHERVSIWGYQDDRTKLVCLDLFEQTLECHSSGQELTPAQFPNYFRSLEVERVIDAENAITDPRTAEFAESYLKPLGIGSMLDSPYLVGGEIGGVVCFEHVGSPRSYSAEHLEFAAAVADVVTLAREAHERKRAQRAVIENERNLRRIFDALPQFVSVRTQGQIVLENKALESSKARPSSDHEARLAAEQTVEPEYVEETLTDGRGNLKTLQTKTLPIEFAGRPSLLEVSNDITELKRSEALQIGWNRILENLAIGEKLPSILSRLAKLAEETTPGARSTVMLLDEDRRVLRVAAAPSWPDEYVARLDQLRIGPDIPSFGLAAHLGREVIAEDTSQHPGWKKFSALVEKLEIRACWSRPILSKANEVMGTFSLSFPEPRGPTRKDRAFMRQCSHVAGIAIEHWNTERKYEEVQSMLESRVEERTADLLRVNRELQEEVSVRERAERLLHRTATDLQRSNADLEEFAYVASHDLQSPLREIESTARMLMDSPPEDLSDGENRYLSRICSTASKMRMLISDLLTFSTVGSGDVPNQRVELSEIVDDVLTDLKKQIDEIGAEIIVGELPAVHAHPTEMRQLLQNLIGNSLIYRLPDTHTVIRVEGGLAPAKSGTGETRDFVEIRVSDNGIGFKIELLDRILSPFQRLHGSRHFEGTGIGLAICRKIVQRRGGEITAESTPGKGSTFIVRLPSISTAGEDD